MLCNLEIDVRVTHIFSPSFRFLNKMSSIVSCSMSLRTFCLMLIAFNGVLTSNVSLPTERIQGGMFVTSPNNKSVKLNISKESNTSNANNQLVQVIRNMQIPKKLNDLEYSIDSKMNELKSMLNANNQLLKTIIGK